MFIFICINLMFVLGIYKQIIIVMNIPKFNEFKVDEAVVAAGFGQSNMAPYSISTSIPSTGYTMQPVVGMVESCSNHIAEQANAYETNDNEDHTAEGYLKEAKHYLNEAIDKAYETKCGMSEAMVQIAGDKKPSGAKVLAMVIVDHLIDKKIVTRAYKKKLEAEIQDIIINSTF